MLATTGTPWLNILTIAVALVAQAVTLSLGAIALKRAGAQRWDKERRDVYAGFLQQMTTVKMHAGLRATGHPQPGPPASELLEAESVLALVAPKDTRDVVRQAVNASFLLFDVRATIGAQHLGQFDELVETFIGYARRDLGIERALPVPSVP
jgi:hypothetical protein